MKRAHSIAGDTHCKETDLAVVAATGRLTKPFRCPTTIPALTEAIRKVPRPRYPAFEEALQRKVVAADSEVGRYGGCATSRCREGPVADWPYRSLLPFVDRITVCEPRRNHLIAKGGDHDDPIDAEKLAQLLRGGHVQRVHPPESFERSVFKHHAGLYHGRVEHRVEEANRIMGFLRRYGVFVQERAFADPGDLSSREDGCARSTGAPLEKSKKKHTPRGGGVLTSRFI